MFVLPLEEGAEATLYAITNGNYTKGDSVRLNAVILRENESVYEATTNVTVSTDTNSLVIYLPAKWVPSRAGDYNIIFTIIDANKNKKLSEESRAVNVKAKQITQVVTPGFAEQIGNTFVDNLQLEYFERSTPLLMISLIILSVLLSVAVVRLRKE